MKTLLILIISILAFPIPNKHPQEFLVKNHNINEIRLDYGALVRSEMFRQGYATITPEELSEIDIDIGPILSLVPRTQKGSTKYPIKFRDSLYYISGRELFLNPDQRIIIRGSVIKELKILFKKIN